MVKPVIKRSGTYQLLDSGDFQKLERVGPFILVRPALQAIWEPTCSRKLWASWDARFERSTKGYGKWTYQNSSIQNEWPITYGSSQFLIKLTGFGHIGLFPEQGQNLGRIQKIIQNSPFQSNVLNLFAYTGAATVALALAGAKVTHVDAVKSTVQWARTNTEMAGVNSEAVRWIVEDVNQFIKRLINRGETVDAIILDPPSFGRGPKKEQWKIETHLTRLLNNLKNLFSKRFHFLLLSAHTPGYTPLALENCLKGCCPKDGTIRSGEMVLKEFENERFLPSGAYALWEKEKQS